MQHADNRNTVCVSCMVGCPVNCKFCATGKMGFGGNLSTREMVDQVLYFARMLIPENKKITNIVFMGMGEPLLNLDNVLAAIEIFSSSDKFGLSTRRITISTSGFIEGIKKLIKSDFKGRLAVSLHAPNQKLRKKLMPVAKTNKFEDLFRVLDLYVEKTNKRITYEYVLIKNVNDHPGDALELSKLLKPRLHHVNLIPYNPVPGKKFIRPGKDRIDKFTSVLSKNNINFTLRITMGDDVQAACGQLATYE